MKKTLAALILILPALSLAKVDLKKTPSKRTTANSDELGTSQVSLQEKGGWLRIEGVPAKALYEKLAGEGKNAPGEADNSMYFKKGKSYSCNFHSTTDTYSCTVLITNSRQGLL